jgi:membrane protein implicated in regulation of membrane protease activity
VVEVAQECRPVGSVRIRGELWKAHCPEGASAGDRVRVTGLHGLTLEVERAA